MGEGQTINCWLSCRIMNTPPVRVVIYARGTHEEIQAQQEQARTMAEEGRNSVVALASDPPSGIDGWMSAQEMIRDGTADRIIIASRAVIPNMIDSVTMKLPGRRPRRVR